MNIEISGEGFFISWNPDTRQGMFGDSDGGEETGLVFDDFPHGKDGHCWTGKAYFLLKGDFRGDYRKIVEDGGGKWDCKLFYDSQKKKHGSRWSTDFHEWGKDGTARHRAESRTARPHPNTAAVTPQPARRKPKAADGRKSNP